jgi:outer membrane protein insertion porin family
VKRALLFVLAAAACGPSAPAQHVAEKPLPAYVCPAAPKINTDPTEIKPLVGKTVAHVCVVGGSNEARAAVGSSLGTKPGSPLDMKRVRDDLAFVMDLPMIDDVSASATRDESGLTIFYAIRERPVIASLQVEGVHAFSRAEIESAPIAEGQHLDTHALRVFARTLEEAYQERGYGSAKVEYEVKTPEPGKARVSITVREGMPWRFGAIVFQGNKVLAQAELAKVADIQTGDKWNADRLDRAQLLVQALAYNHGLVESSVKVDHAAADANGAVPVTFTLVEGNVFVLRKISVRGVEPAVEKQALAAMKAKPKSIFVRDVVTNDITLMSSSLNMDVVPEMSLDPKTKSVDLVLDAKKKVP